MNTLKIILATRDANAVSHKLLLWVTRRTGAELCRIGNRIFETAECGVCEHCDDYALSDDIHTVNTRSSAESGRRRMQEAWCEDCLDNDTFYCQRSNEYFCSRSYDSAGVEGETVCLQRFQDDLYFWQSDGEYHWDSEPENEESDDISEYHSQRRPWRDKVFSGAVFGVELECMARGERIDVASVAERYGLLAEKDGSLCDTSGIEIVGPPLPLAEYYKAGGSWQKFLSDARVKAWDAGAGYGMHISLNRRAMVASQTAKIVAFIHSNRGFCEIVAGRSQNEWATYHAKRISHGYAAEGNKYDAAALRSSDRLEIRIFRATAKKESFLKNVEFTAALAEYCAQASFQELRAVQFYVWLDKTPGFKFFKAWSASCDKIKTLIPVR